MSLIAPQTMLLCRGCSTASPQKRGVNENERGIDERIIVLQVKDFGQECGLRSE